MDPEKGQATGGGSPEPAQDTAAPAGGLGAIGGDALNRALRALVTGTTHLVALVETDGTIAYIGPSVLLQLGYGPDQLMGQNFAGYVHPEDLDSAATMLAAEGTRPGHSGEFGADADIAGEYRFRHADGRWIPFEVVRNNFLADPDIRAVLIMARPVGARHALDQALSVLAYEPDGSAALARLAEYLDGRLPGTASAVVVGGTPGEWIGGPSIAGLLGGRGPWDRALSTGEPVLAPVGGEGEEFDPAMAEEAAQRGYRACWCLPLPIRSPRVYTMGADGERARDFASAAGPEGEVSGCLVVWAQRDLEPPTGYLGVLERVGGLADLAIRRRRERQRMRHMVDFDQVTGALSRAGLDSMISGSESLPRARLLIDLDDFKDVNDRHGHIMGDDVLRVAVKRLLSVLRYQDLLARLGGDEFLLLVAGAGEEDAVTVARRVASVLDDPITVGAVSVHVRASIGIAPWDPAATPAQLIDRADQAMYAAKRGGKNRWSVWGA